jgi:7-keto-8-aminopelargonate synthetase-like enzyme
MAIRLIHCGEATVANALAVELANHGFLTSAVCCPVVAQDKAAIRITLRADMTPTLIRDFCALVTDFLHTHGRDIGC